MIGIYKITNPKGKIYIGQSVNIERRFKDYKRLSDCKGQRALYKSFLKYGVDKHKFQILTECTESELNNLERYYQDLFDVTNSKIGLNCKLTKSNDRSGKMSKETIEKNRLGQIKRFQNPEEIDKNSRAQKRLYENGYINPMKGIKMSEESCKKMRESRKILFENGYVSPHKGTKRTSESNKKQSESMKKKYNDGLNPWNKGKKTGKPSASSKAVINTQNGFIYDSAREACVASGLKISEKSFSRKLSGKRKNDTNFEYVDNL